MLQYAHPASEEAGYHKSAPSPTGTAFEHIPEILVVDAKVPPMMWAFGRRARMVLPSGLLDTMGHDEQAGLIAHELAHLKRRDHWIRWFEFVVLGVYWWNPDCLVGQGEYSTGGGGVLRRVGAIDISGQGLPVRSNSG